MAIDDDVQGEVVKITSTDVMVLSTEGFEIAYATNELVADLSKQENLDFSANFNSLASENTSFKKKPKSIQPRKKEKLQPPMEVDLHIHKLVKNYKSLSSYEMLNIQSDTAKRQLDFAISKRISRVIFIHGVGQGVLKSELEYLFRQYDNIRVSEGDYRKYGVGAMEIYITQKAF